MVELRHAEDLTADAIDGFEALIADDRTGIIQTMVELPVQPNDPKLFMMGARLGDNSRWLPERVPSVLRDCGGAALTRWEAKAAAIGECIERYCASIIWHDELVYASYGELHNDYRLPHPATFALFHPDQYRDLVYTPFTEDTRIGWMPAASLADDGAALVPACFVYLGYRAVQEQGDHLLGPSISTGCACARTFRKALLKAIYEVVERDAFTIMWLNRMAPKRIPLDADPSLQELYTNTLAASGLEYHLFRLPSDLAIPTFLSVVIDTRGAKPLAAVGGAAHLNPLNAARKALVESAQTLEYARRLAKQKTTKPLHRNYDDVISFDDHTMLYAQGEMLSALEFLLETPPAAEAQRLLKGVDMTTEKQLHVLKEELEKHKLECFAVDLTTPDMAALGFSVAKAVIPSLQPLNGPYTQRFLGGRRLYEVPVRLGLRTAPVDRDGFNPDPHPYP